MDLRDLQRHWDQFGRTIPLWSILTDPTKTERDWDLVDFFATGAEEIAGTMVRIHSLDVSPPTTRALDFGCGVGRLTQALCDHFRECVGVDIAPSMLALARQYNRFGSRCQYSLNQTDDLAQFPDAYFDFVYTARVLQHMQPEYSTRYLGEFLRVLAPGGVLVFQLPSEPATRGMGLLRSPDAARALLPDGGYRAHISVLGAPRTAKAGMQVTVTARVKNVGDTRWPAIESEDGRGQLKLGNHWLDADGATIVHDDARSPLRGDLDPGETIELPITVNVPQTSGRYTLRIDMVHEGITWFQDRGSAPGSIDLEVVGGSERPPSSLARTAARELPKVQAAATRSGPIASPQTNVDGFEPRMEMHGVKRADVARVIEQHGGTVIDVQRDHLAGDDWVEFRYFVKK